MADLGFLCLLSRRDFAHSHPERTQVSTDFGSSDCHINTLRVEEACQQLTPVRNRVERTFQKASGLPQISSEVMLMELGYPSKKDVGYSLGSELEAWELFCVLVTPTG